MDVENYIVDVHVCGDRRHPRRVQAHTSAMLRARRRSTASSWRACMTPERYSPASAIPTRTRPCRLAIDELRCAHLSAGAHYGTITLGMRFFDAEVTLGTRVVFASLVGGRCARIAATATPSAGYTLVDLFTSYKFDGGVEVHGSVTNLFDTVYTPASTTPITSACAPFPRNGLSCGAPTRAAAAPACSPPRRISEDNKNAAADRRRVRPKHETPVASVRPW